MPTSARLLGARRCFRISLSASGLESWHLDLPVRARRVRGLMTVFGLVAALRMSYGWRRHQSLSPLDASLNLSKELHSHGLRRLAAAEAARGGSFDGTVEAIERNTGTKVPKRQVEGLVGRAAQDFDAFYNRSESAEAAASEKDLLVLSLDAKGIVMRGRGPAGGNAQGSRELRAQARDKALQRREEKKETLATVAAVYDLTPQPRQQEDVLGELRPVRDSKPRPTRTQEARVGERGEDRAGDHEQRVRRACRRDPEHPTALGGPGGRGSPADRPCTRGSKRVAVSGKTLRWLSISSTCWSTSGTQPGASLTRVTATPRNG